LFLFFFFFFQAEDGIRAFHVTRVQTCALPISSFAPVTFLYVFELFNGKERTMWLALINTGFLTAGILGQLAASFLLNIGTWTWEIGRASCRERVEDWGVALTL